MRRSDFNRMKKVSFSDIEDSGRSDLIKFDRFCDENDCVDDNDGQGKRCQHYDVQIESQGNKYRKYKQKNKDPDFWKNLDT